MAGTSSWCKHALLVVSHTAHNNSTNKIRYQNRIFLTKVYKTALYNNQTLGGYNIALSALTLYGLRSCGTACPVFFGLLRLEYQDVVFLYTTSEMGCQSSANVALRIASATTGTTACNRHGSISMKQYIQCIYETILFLATNIRRYVQSG